MTFPNSWHRWISLSLIISLLTDSLPANAFPARISTTAASSILFIFNSTALSEEGLLQTHSFAIPEAAAVREEARAAETMSSEDLAKIASIDNELIAVRKLGHGSAFSDPFEVKSPEHSRTVIKIAGGKLVGPLAGLAQEELTREAQALNDLGPSGYTPKMYKLYPVEKDRTVIGAFLREFIEGDLLAEAIAKGRIRFSDVERQIRGLTSVLAALGYEMLDSAHDNLIVTPENKVRLVDGGLVVPLRRGGQARAARERNVRDILFEIAKLPGAAGTLPNNLDRVKDYVDEVIARRQKTGRDAYAMWDRLFFRLRKNKRTTIEEKVAMALEDLEPAGISPALAAEIAPRVHPFSIHPERLSTGNEVVDGLIVADRGVLQILLPRMALDAMATNQKTSTALSQKQHQLAKLLHEIIEVKLVETNVPRAEAHETASFIEETYRYEGPARTKYVLQDLLHIASLEFQKDPVSMDQAFSGIIGAAHRHSNDKNRSGWNHWKRPHRPRHAGNSVTNAQSDLSERQRAIEAILASHPKRVLVLSTGDILRTYALRLLRIVAVLLDSSERTVPSRFQALRSLIEPFFLGATLAILAVISLPSLLLLPVAVNFFIAGTAWSLGRAANLLTIADYDEHPHLNIVSYVTLILLPVFIFGILLEHQVLIYEGLHRGAALFLSIGTPILLAISGALWKRPKRPVNMWIRRFVSVAVLGGLLVVWTHTATPFFKLSSAA